MTLTTDERIQFLTDILITAVEGGIGYWSVGSHYDYDNPDPTKRGYTIELVDDEDMDALLPIRIGLDELATAVRQLCRPNEEVPLGVHESYRAALRIAAELGDTCPDSESDGAMDIDAFFADIVFQVALFGDTVFG